MKFSCCNTDPFWENKISSKHYVSVSMISLNWYFRVVKLSLETQSMLSTHIYIQPQRSSLLRPPLLPFPLSWNCHLQHQHCAKPGSRSTSATQHVWSRLCWAGVVPGGPQGSHSVLAPISREASNSPEHENPASCVSQA